MEEVEIIRKKRIRRLFDELDAGKRGYLDIPSLRKSSEAYSQKEITSQPIPPKSGKIAWVTNKRPSPLASPLPPEIPQFKHYKFARDLIPIAEGSPDKVVTFESFDTFMRNKEKEIKRIFVKMDIDSNQALNHGEIRAAVKVAGIPVTDEELSKFISHIDQDCSGYITWNEWRDFLLVLPGPPTLKNLFSSYRDIVFDIDSSYSGDSFGIIRHETEDTPLITRLKFFFSGGIAGAISRTATAPLDRIRVFMQTGTSRTKKTGIPVRTPPIKWGIFRSARYIYGNGGGIRGFYKGNGLNIVKTLIRDENDNGTIGPGGRFIAGGCAGLVSQFAIFPLETMKIRVMSELSQKPVILAKQRPNLHTTPQPTQSLIMRIALDMYKNGGIRSFYRGCMPSLLGIIPYAGIDLTVFEQLKITWMNHYGKEDDDSPSIPAILFFGMISGTASATVMYPLAVVRTRLQAQGTPSHPECYSSFFNAIKKAFRREGFQGFYKGLVPTLLKVIPSVSISYAAYESMKKTFGVV